MACKTGGAGLNNIYENFGYNEDKIFIMAYADGFDNATMIGTYNLIPLELKFPLVCQEGGSEEIDSVLGHPYTAGGWLLHPDGRKEQVSYNEKILTNKLDSILLNNCCSETVNKKIQLTYNNLKTSIYSKNKTVILNTFIEGKYSITIFSMNGRIVYEHKNYYPIGINIINVKELSKGLYMLNINGPKCRQNQIFKLYIN